MDKIQALSTAIKTVFDQDDQDIAVFANDKIPRGYLARIKQLLPTGYQWPKDESNLSRLIIQNKPNILKILRESLNVDNTTTLSSAIVERFVAEPKYVEHVEHSEEKSSVHSEHSETSEHLTREDVSRMIAEALHRLKPSDPEKAKIFKWGPWQEFIQSKEPVPGFLQTRRPGRKKKDETVGRQWEKLQTSVDKRLFEMFCAEAEERQLNKAQMLDIILSERYGSKTD